MPRFDSRWMFVVVMVVGLVSLARSYQWYGTLIRGSDAYYYHAFAHSLVFDGDTDMTNNLEIGPNPWYLDPDGDRTWTRVPRRADGGFRMKHPIGVSLLAAPGLAVGVGLRQVASWVGIDTEGPPGYSFIELYAATASLLLVVAIGVALAYRAAVEFCGRAPAVVGVLACAFGTSLFHYAAVQSYWAHGASFGVLVMIMVASRPLWGDGPVNRALVLIGLGLALVILIRPQQGLAGVMLAPILARVVWTRRVSDWMPGAVAGLVACGLAAWLQAWMNSVQFGQWTLNAYQASGEVFMRGGEDSPGLFERLWISLFWRDRGLLVLSPIVLVAAAGLIRHARQVPGYMWPAVANAAAQIVVIAAWSPHQGESFGSRMWTDTSFVVIFGVGLLYGQATGRWRVAVGTAAAACVGVTMYHLVKYMGFFV